MKQIATILSILICLTAVGCKDGPGAFQKPRATEPDATEPNLPEPNEPPSIESPTVPPADAFEILGTVVYKRIEGGFFAIDADDGRKYDPINLPEPFRKHGLKVKVTARPRIDVRSVHMYGLVIEVVNIEAR